MRLVTPLEMMKLEDLANQSGVTYDIMMNRAGAGLAEHLGHIANECNQKKILFLCGNGNNAGDCFVAATHLAAQFEITVALTNGVPKTRTAYTKFRLMKHVTVLEDHAKILDAVREHAIVVDGIFGIGFRGELSSQIQELFAAAAESPDRQIIAVDIPSGGSGLNGTVSPGTPHCNVTVTFGAAKTGLFITPLSEHCGAILLVDIGLPEDAFDALKYPITHINGDTVRGLLPSRPQNGHKGMFGKLLCVTGSRRMPGAAILAARAALRCGVGLCCLASDPETCRMLVVQSPEATIQPLTTDQNGMLTQKCIPEILEAAKNASCVLIGCGLGQSDEVRSVVRTLITELDCPIILDADGLNAIVSGIDILRRAKSTVVLTPHPAEMARLLHCTTEDVQKDRVTAAKRLASRFTNTVVVLKGAGTIVALSDHASINTNGNSGMSKGGSGDVLAGIIASLTAQHIPPEHAAQIGVYLHGLAGDCAAAEFSRRAMLPSDMIRQLPMLFGEFE